MATKTKTAKLRSTIKAPTDHPFISDIEAQALHAELQHIEKKYGYVRPETVLEEARRNPRSKFRKYLEWDDTKAGDQFRLVQVRRLIIVIREVVTIGEKQIEITAWQSVTRQTPEFRGRVRVMARRAFSNPDWAEEIIAREMKEMRRVRSRLTAYTELRGIFAQLIGAIDQLDIQVTSGTLPKKK
jgi:hypothetical protein